MGSPPLEEEFPLLQPGLALGISNVPSQIILRNYSAFKSPGTLRNEGVDSKGWRKRGKK